MDGDKKVCRACACESDKFRALHKEGLIMGEITTLAKLLSFCIDIEFPPDEQDMPSVICEKCVQKLAKAYKFKQQVLLANEHLRGMEETTEITITDDSGQAEYIMVGVVKTKDGEEEFIISERVPIQNEMVTFNQEELEEVEEEKKIIKDLKKSKKDVEVADEELELTVETKPVTSEEQESNIEIEVVDIETENVSSNKQFSIKNLNVKKENAYHNYVVSMIDGDEHNIHVKNCNEDFITLADVDNSQSDRPSPTRSHSQSQESDGQSDTVEDKLLKIAPKLKPVKKRNMKTKPKEPRPDLQCEVCGKQLSNPNSYKYHMQLHSDDTPYLCSLCGEGFKTRNAHDGHKAVHDPNNPNKCDLCGKTYRQASSLRAHLLTHTGEKPFVCDICGKGMTQKSGYKKHMLTHTGEKPHCCDYCGREFRYSSNLIAHRRCHTGEKPYECQSCSKCFVSSEQLKRHRVVHTGDRPHKCETCDKRFKRRATLLQHSQIHIGEDTKIASVKIKEKTTKSNLIEIY